MQVLTPEQDKFFTITEQGNFGLGVGEVTDEKERQMLKQRLNEMHKQSDQLRNQK